MKTQIFFIHGGSVFKNNKDYLHYLKTRTISLQKKVYWGVEYTTLEKHFEIIQPRMPLKDNAKYAEWKIHFERHFPLLKDNIIFIGSSLGGIFLAKYLSEHKFPKKILSTYLIAPPFESTPQDFVGDFKLKSNLTLLEKNSKNLYLMFSKDDPYTPVAHAEKYRKKLKNAQIIIYENKNGHFGVSEFPEIIELIKNGLKRK